jgi:transglutaminase-like putative cysteine protease
MLYRMTGFTILILAAALSSTVPRSRAAAAGDDAPAWLRQAAAASAPAYDKDVPAVVINDESTINVGEDGRVTTVTTFAVRVLTHAGIRRAAAAAHYETDSGGKILEMRAWLIRPDGSVRKYGKDETVDRIADSDSLYDESRVKQIDATRDAEVGSVFGYQTTSEDRPWFPQAGWWFQGDLPSLGSRLTVTVPSGWRAAGTIYNAPKLDPNVSGNSYTWEMRDLPRVENEPASPSMRSLAAHVAVKYGPAPGSPSSGVKSFENWTDVSRWYTELADPQAAPDDAIATKARELTATAKTELEKIQAIGRYVQSIQYISVQIGIGGYRPHAATQVFAKQYGDCKDKANLMRAMLRAVKVESYLVLIRAEDHTFVREDLVSPAQFNHCIVAVRIGDETKAASVIRHPTLGRLLIFDATDESTQVGDLPEDEQGSFALVAAGADGSLVLMPVMPPDASRLERTTDVTLQQDGSIAATVSEHSFGQSAAFERSLFKQLSRGDYEKVIQIWAGSGATGAKFTKIEPADGHAEGRFVLDVEFTAPAYAQSMQDRLLVFKPSVVGHINTAWLADEKRKHPVVLKSKAINDTVRFKLPAGFDVDEMPDPVKLTSEFGTYTASYEVKDGQLVFTRSLVQHAATIPVERYADVRNFFGRVRASEDAPVVLARK